MRATKSTKELNPLLIGGCRAMLRAYRDFKSGDEGVWLDAPNRRVPTMIMHEQLKSTLSEIGIRVVGRERPYATLSISILGRMYWKVDHKSNLLAALNIDDQLYLSLSLMRYNRLKFAAMYMPEVDELYYVDPMVGIMVVDGFATILANQPVDSLDCIAAPILRFDPNNIAQTRLGIWFG